jgi:DNA-directed RNA polymerase specialized sigma24 family protein
MSEIAPEKLGRPPAILSKAEIIKALQKLTATERTGLVKIAKLYSTRTRYDHEDLINEAFVRVLDGRRVWKVGEPAAKFFYLVIKSIAWEWGRRSEVEVAEDIVDPNVRDPGPMIDAENLRVHLAEFFHGDPNLQKTVWDMMRGLELQELEVVALFRDDLAALRMVMSMMTGVRGEELQAVSGLTKVEYETKRKKIRRRLEQARP